MELCCGDILSGGKLLSLASALTRAERPEKLLTWSWRSRGAGIDFLSAIPGNICHLLTVQQTVHALREQLFDHAFHPSSKLNLSSKRSVLRYLTNHPTSLNSDIYKVN